MCDVKKIKEEELKKVSGGLKSVDCSTCGLFIAKDPNALPNFLNCKRYDANVNLCPVLSDAGYEA